MVVCLSDDQARKVEGCGLVSGTVTPCAHINATVVMYQCTGYMITTCKRQRRRHSAVPTSLTLFP